VGKHCSRPTTLIEFSVWKAYPDAGIGVACGAAVGVDVDIVEDAAVAVDVERLARRRLGDTPLMRIGLAPKRLLVYRAEQPFAGFKTPPIEVLARGQQFVAHAIHPETGEPYHWVGDSPADVPLSGLPAVTEKQCRQFVKEALELVPPELRPARLLNGGNNGGAEAPSPLGQRGTYDAVASALEALPNQDLPYDNWIRIGLATKAPIGDAGLLLFMRWSAKSKKDHPEFTAKTYNGLHDIHSIGVGTLYDEAKKHGWVSDPSTLSTAPSPGSRTVIRRRNCSIALRPSRARPNPTSTFLFPTPSDNATA
jgi:hypothetical protein